MTHGYAPTRCDYGLNSEHGILCAYAAFDEPQIKMIGWTSDGAGEIQSNIEWENPKCRSLCQCQHNETTVSRQYLNRNELLLLLLLLLSLFFLPMMMLCSNALHFFITMVQKGLAFIRLSPVLCVWWFWLFFFPFACMPYIRNIYTSIHQFFYLFIDGIR